jgi:hypothetical protein
MSNVARERNPMPVLREPTPPPPEEDPMTMKPLDNTHLFESKKEVKIKEPQIEAEPAPIPSIVPKKKKKRTISEAHKKALEAGRLKGLETRRRKAQERKALKAKEKKEKKLRRVAERVGLDPNSIQYANNEPESKAPPVINNHKDTVEIAQAIKEEPKIRKAVESKKSSYNPDDEFKKFYTMMSKYEAVRYQQKMNAQKKYKRPDPPKPKIAPRRNLHQRINQFGQSQRRGRNPMNKQPQNNYLNFFT